ncbi:hypothetical protein R3W88_029283 [Solanum pinnatisectum]|uniref:Uncharacterized protein n=1 Tax=Solanum pinnatisectum TaxID=50273 RepID=A0AAV9K5Z1_9SOLN|nr:hypothetical protein R3W88_029283 [Solanum pinnatisectum]
MEYPTKWTDILKALEEDIPWVKTKVLGEQPPGKWLKRSSYVFCVRGEEGDVVYVEAKEMK